MCGSFSPALGILSVVSLFYFTSIAMVAAQQLQLVLVTPETTLLDQPVKALRFPLFDGLIGILPGRAPLVGRLGLGELKFETPSGSSEHYYIEGGFAQVKGSVVTLLTNRALPVSKIDADKAQAELDAALASTPADQAARDQKKHLIERNRKLIELKRKN